MRNIFVIISKDIIRRNILDTAFWQTFISGIDVKDNVILVVDEESREYISSKYTSSQVEVVGYSRKPHRGIEKVLNFLIRTGVNSHSTRTYRNRAVKRGQSTLASYYFKGFIANTFGRMSWYKRLLRKWFLQSRGPQEVYDLFDRYKPYALFAPSLIDNEFDAQFARVAKQRKCKLIGMVRSWDNLNNHGLLAVVPDVFLLQNIWLKEAAQTFQAIDFDTITHSITGLPHYDEYFRLGENVKSREVFFESLGINPEKKVILLGGSDFYYSEYMVPKLLDDAIESGEIKGNPHIIFRPHPRSLFKIEEYHLDGLSHVTLDDAFSGKVMFSDTEKFNNLLFHSDIIINICSTLSIDAAVVDKPAIAINFDDPELSLSYYERVGRLYDQFDHYEKLIAAGGTANPTSPELLIESINRYLENPRADAAGQREIIRLFVDPYDGLASKRVAERVIEALC